MTGVRGDATVQLFDSGPEGRLTTLVYVGAVAVDGATGCGARAGGHGGPGRRPRFGERAEGVGVVSYLRFEREEIPAAEGEPYPSFVSRAPVDPHLTQAGGGSTPVSCSPSSTSSAA